ALRDHLEAQLKQLSGVRIFAAHAERLPNTVQFAIDGYAGEWLVMELDRRGFAVSSGSACHSASGRPSHVLLAMGCNDTVARGAVRVSLGVENSVDDLDALLATLGAITARRRGAVACAYSPKCAPAANRSHTSGVSVPLPRGQGQPRWTRIRSRTA
ncbi:MAG: aminotransferase class V-fold PLP-dependent enzyme, partial [Gammaproteobacteria bacterium]|nr:aminotransferase class V-fold PLP-dependent enzyme [Gammaproteobacteria bacterium]